jgi:hypothetical protein
LKTIKLKFRCSNCGYEESVDIKGRPEERFLCGDIAGYHRTGDMRVNRVRSSSLILTPPSIGKDFITKVHACEGDESEFGRMDIVGVKFINE